MTDIIMLSSGNILKDYIDFLDGIDKKIKIKNKQEFHKDFLNFLSTNLNGDLSNPDKIPDLAKENNEDFKKIVNDFFKLLDKHSSGDFDFYEGSIKEIEFLEKILKERKNGN